MTWIYTDAEINRQKARASMARTLSCGLLGAALIVCVVFCCLTNTGNARAMLLWTIGIFTVAGWIAIGEISLVYRPCQAEYLHSMGLKKEERQTLTGSIGSVSPAFHIPKSITVRKVSLTNEEGTQTLNILAGKAGLLPEPGSRVEMQIARSYIVAFEVRHEEG